MLVEQGAEGQEATDDVLGRVGPVHPQEEAVAPTQKPVGELVEDFPFAVAAYCVCDVLVVNALADGMNLVAKEFPLVNRRDGVLALSENAGAWEELGQDAITMYPFDVQQQADALYEALMMPADERHRRMDAIRTQVRTHDIQRWLTSQLDDLRALLS